MDPVKENAVKHVVHSFRHSSSQEKFSFTRVLTIDNVHTAEKFKERIKELVERGYSEDEVQIDYGFLLVEENEVEKICREGISVGNVDSSLLGCPEMGVQLSQYADILRPTALPDKFSGTIIVFKIIKGRVKKVAGDQSSSNLQPTPCFDCHILKHSGYDGNSDNMEKAFNLSQVYLYEYGDLGCVEYPRHIQPYAILHFTYDNLSPTSHCDTSLTCRVPPQNEQLYCDPMETKPLEEHVVWNGQLCIKNHYACDVEMFSSTGVFKPTRIGKRLNIVHKASFSVIDEKFLLKTNFIEKKTETQIGDQYITYCHLKPLTAKEEKNFKKIMLYFSKNNVAAIFSLEESVDLLLMPDCPLTHLKGALSHVNNVSKQLLLASVLEQKLTEGLSKKRRYRTILHCLFSSKVSAKDRMKQRLKKFYENAINKSSHAENVTNVDGSMKDDITTDSSVCSHGLPQDIPLTEPLTVSYPSKQSDSEPVVFPTFSKNTEDGFESVHSLAAATKDGVLSKNSHHSIFNSDSFSQSPNSSNSCDGVHNSLELSYLLLKKLFIDQQLHCESFAKKHEKMKHLSTSNCYKSLENNSSSDHEDVISDVVEDIKVENSSLQEDTYMDLSNSPNIYGDNINNNSSISDPVNQCLTPVKLGKDHTQDSTTKLEEIVDRIRDTKKMLKGNSVKTETLENRTPTKSNHEEKSSKFRSPEVKYGDKTSKSAKKKSKKSSHHEPDESLYPKKKIKSWTYANQQKQAEASKVLHDILSKGNDVQMMKIPKKKKTNEQKDRHTKEQKKDSVVNVKPERTEKKQKSLSHDDSSKTSASRSDEKSVKTEQKLSKCENEKNVISDQSATEPHLQTPSAVVKTTEHLDLTSATQPQKSANTSNSRSCESNSDNCKSSKHVKRSVVSMSDGTVYVTVGQDPKIMALDFEENYSTELLVYEILHKELTNFNSISTSEKNLLGSISVGLHKSYGQDMRLVESYEKEIDSANISQTEKTEQVTKLKAIDHSLKNLDKIAKTLSSVPSVDDVPCKVEFVESKKIKELQSKIDESLHGGISEFCMNNDPSDKEASAYQDSTVSSTTSPKWKKMCSNGLDVSEEFIVVDSVSGDNNDSAEDPNKSVGDEESLKINRKSDGKCDGKNEEGSENVKQTHGKRKVEVSKLMELDITADKLSLNRDVTKKNGCVGTEKESAAPELNKNKTLERRHGRQFHPYERIKAPQSDNSSWSFNLPYQDLQELMQNLTTPSYRRKSLGKDPKSPALPPAGAGRFTNYHFNRSTNSIDNDDFEEKRQVTMMDIPNFEERRRKAEYLEMLYSNQGFYNQNLNSGSRKVTENFSSSQKSGQNSNKSGGKFSPIFFSYCSLCQVIFKHEKNLAKHSKEKMHLQLERKMRNTKKYNKDVLYCTLCEVNCSSIISFNDHIHGYKHKQNKERMGLSPVFTVIPALNLSPVASKPTLHRLTLGDADKSEVIDEKGFIVTKDSSCSIKNNGAAKKRGNPGKGNSTQRPSPISKKGSQLLEHSSKHRSSSHKEEKICKDKLTHFPKAPKGQASTEPSATKLVNKLSGNQSSKLQSSNPKEVKVLKDKQVHLPKAPSSQNSADSLASKLANKLSGSHSSKLQSFNPKDEKVLKDKDVHVLKALNCRTSAQPSASEPVNEPSKDHFSNHQSSNPEEEKVPKDKEVHLPKVPRGQPPVELLTLESVNKPSGNHSSMLQSSNPKAVKVLKDKQVHLPKAQSSQNYADSSASKLADKPSGNHSSKLQSSNPEGEKVLKDKDVHVPKSSSDQTSVEPSTPESLNKPSKNHFSNHDSSNSKEEKVPKDKEVHLPKTPSDQTFAKLLTSESVNKPLTNHSAKDHSSNYKVEKVPEDKEVHLPTAPYGRTSAEPSTSKLKKKPLGIHSSTNQSSNPKWKKLLGDKEGHLPKTFSSQTSVKLLTSESANKSLRNHSPEHCDRKGENMLRDKEVQLPKTPSSQTSAEPFTCESKSKPSRNHSPKHQSSNHKEGKVLKEEHLLRKTGSQITLSEPSTSESIDKPSQNHSSKCQSHNNKDQKGLKDNEVHLLKTPSGQTSAELLTSGSVTKPSKNQSPNHQSSNSKEKKVMKNEEVHLPETLKSQTTFVDLSTSDNMNETSRNLTQAFVLEHNYGMSTQHTLEKYDLDKKQSERDKGINGSIVLSSENRNSVESIQHSNWPDVCLHAGNSAEPLISSSDQATGLHYLKYPIDTQPEKTKMSRWDQCSKMKSLPHLRLEYPERQQKLATANHHQLISNVHGKYEKDVSQPKSCKKQQLNEVYAKSRVRKISGKNTNNKSRELTKNALSFTGSVVRDINYNSRTKRTSRARSSRWDKRHIQAVGRKMTAYDKSAKKIGTNESESNRKFLDQAQVTKNHMNDPLSANDIFEEFRSVDEMAVNTNSLAKAICRYFDDQNVDLKKLCPVSKKTETVAQETSLNISDTKCFTDSHYVDKGNATKKTGIDTSVDSTKLFSSKRPTLSIIPNALEVEDGIMASGDVFSKQDHHSDCMNWSTGYTARASNTVHKQQTKDKVKNQYPSSHMKYICQTVHFYLQDPEFKTIAEAKHVPVKIGTLNGEMSCSVVPEDGINNYGKISSSDTKLETFSSQDSMTDESPNLESSFISYPSPKLEVTLDGACMTDGNHQIAVDNHSFKNSEMDANEFEDKYSQGNVSDDPINSTQFSERDLLHKPNFDQIHRSHKLSNRRTDEELAVNIPTCKSFSSCHLSPPGSSSINLKNESDAVSLKYKKQRGDNHNMCLSPFDVPNKSSSVDSETTENSNHAPSFHSVAYNNQMHLASNPHSSLSASENMKEIYRHGEEKGLKKTEICTSGDCSIFDFCKEIVRLPATESSQTIMKDVEKRTHFKPNKNEDIRCMKIGPAKRGLVGLDSDCIDPNQGLTNQNISSNVFQNEPSFLLDSCRKSDINSETENKAHILHEKIGSPSSLDELDICDIQVQCDSQFEDLNNFNNQDKMIGQVLLLQETDVRNDYTLKHFSEPSSQTNINDDQQESSKKTGILPSSGALLKVRCESAETSKVHTSNLLDGAIEEFYKEIEPLISEMTENSGLEDTDHKSIVKPSTENAKPANSFSYAQIKFEKSEEISMDYKIEKQVSFDNSKVTIGEVLKVEKKVSDGDNSKVTIGEVLKVEKKVSDGECNVKNEISDSNPHWQTRIKSSVLDQTNVQDDLSVNSHKYENNHLEAVVEDFYKQMKPLLIETTDEVSKTSYSFHTEHTFSEVNNNNSLQNRPAKSEDKNNIQKAAQLCVSSLDTNINFHHNLTETSKTSNSESHSANGSESLKNDSDEAHIYLGENEKESEARNAEYSLKPQISDGDANQRDVEGLNSLHLENNSDPHHNYDVIYKHPATPKNKITDIKFPYQQKSNVSEEKFPKNDTNNQTNMNCERPIIDSSEMWDHPKDEDQIFSRKSNLLNHEYLRTSESPKSVDIEYSGYRPSLCFGQPLLESHIHTFFDGGENIVPVSNGNTQEMATKSFNSLCTTNANNRDDSFQCTDDTFCPNNYTFMSNTANIEQNNLNTLNRQTTVEGNSCNIGRFNISKINLPKTIDNNSHLKQPAFISHTSSHSSVPETILPPVNDSNCVFKKKSSSISKSIVENVDSLSFQIPSAENKPGIHLQSIEQTPVDNSEKTMDPISTSNAPNNKLLEKSNCEVVSNVFSKCTSPMYIKKIDNESLNDKLEIILDDSGGSSISLIENMKTECENLGQKSIFRFDEEKAGMKELPHNFLHSSDLQEKFPNMEKSVEENQHKSIEALFKKNNIECCKTKFNSIAKNSKLSLQNDGNILQEKTSIPESSETSDINFKESMSLHYNLEGVSVENFSQPLTLENKTNSPKLSVLYSKFNDALSPKSQNKNKLKSTENKSSTLCSQPSPVSTTKKEKSPKNQLSMKSTLCTIASYSSQNKSTTKISEKDRGSVIPMKTVEDTKTSHYFTKRLFVNDSEPSSEITCSSNESPSPVCSSDSNRTTPYPTSPHSEDMRLERFRCEPSLQKYFLDLSPGDYECKHSEIIWGESVEIKKTVLGTQKPHHAHTMCEHDESSVSLMHAAEQMKKASLKQKGNDKIKDLERKRVYRKRKRKISTSSISSGESVLNLDDSAPHTKIIKCKNSEERIHKKKKIKRNISTSSISSIECDYHDDLVTQPKMIKNQKGAKKLNRKRKRASRKRKRSISTSSISSTECFSDYLDAFDTTPRIRNEGKEEITRNKSLLCSSKHDSQSNEESLDVDKCKNRNHLNKSKYSERVFPVTLPEQFDRKPLSEARGKTPSKQGCTTSPSKFSSVSCTGSPDYSLTANMYDKLVPSGGSENKFLNAHITTPRNFDATVTARNPPDTFLVNSYIKTGQASEERQPPSKNSLSNMSSKKPEINSELSVSTDLFHKYRDFFLANTSGGDQIFLEQSQSFVTKEARNIQNTLQNRGRKVEYEPPSTDNTPSMSINHSVKVDPFLFTKLSKEKSLLDINYENRFKMLQHIPNKDWKTLPNSSNCGVQIQSIIFKQMARSSTKTMKSKFSDKSSESIFSIRYVEQNDKSACPQFDEMLLMHDSDEHSGTKHYIQMEQPSERNVMGKSGSKINQDSQEKVENYNSNRHVTLTDYKNISVPELDSFTSCDNERISSEFLFPTFSSMSEDFSQNSTESIDSALEESIFRNTTHSESLKNYFLDLYGHSTDFRKSKKARYDNPPEVSSPKFNTSVDNISINKTLLSEQGCSQKIDDYKILPKGDLRNKLKRKTKTQAQSHCKMQNKTKQKKGNDKSDLNAGVISLKMKSNVDSERDFLKQDSCRMVKQNNVFRSIDKRDNTICSKKEKVDKMHRSVFTRLASVVPSAELKQLYIKGLCNDNQTKTRLKLKDNDLRKTKLKYSSRNSSSSDERTVTSS